MSDLLRDDLVYSMFLAKKEMNSEINPDGEAKIEKSLKEKEEFLTKYNSCSDIAFEIYDNNIIKSGNKISKAIIAQILANRIEERYNMEKEKFKNSLEQDASISYLINAIKFVGE